MSSDDDAIEAAQDVPRLVRLSVQNYRVLRDVTLDGLTPLTVLIGPNGSGKSTVLDVLAFLHEAFSTNLRAACASRGGVVEMRSKGTEGPIGVSVDIDFGSQAPTFRYGLSFSERRGEPDVIGEGISLWGLGYAHSGLERVGGEVTTTPFLFPPREVGRQTSKIDPRELAADALARVGIGDAGTIRDFIQALRFWGVGPTRGDQASAARGAAESLDPDGRNLASMIAHLQANEPARMARIRDAMRAAVPYFDDVLAVPTGSGGYTLRFSDRPFAEPIAEARSSEGTLRLLGLMTHLHGQGFATGLLIEEPENQLHPKLHYQLGVELGLVAAEVPIVATTHSPYFANALDPSELWLMHRDEEGYAQVLRASDQERVRKLAAEGGQLGDVWMEGWFGAGDPLKREGRPHQ